MDFIWNSAFEGFPSNSDFGSIMGAVTRDTKAAFEERFSVEHNLDYSSDANCTHKEGECTVVVVGEDAKVPKQVDGGVHHKNGVLFRESASGAMESAAAGDHASMQNKSPDHHPQYFRIDGTDSLNFELTVDSLENLPTEYDGGESNNQVLSRGQHIGTGDPDGTKHTLDSFNFDDHVQTIGVDILKHTHVDDESVSLSGGSAEVRLQDYCSMPLCTAGPDEVALRASEVDNDDYVASFMLEGSDGIYTLDYRYLEA